MKERKGGRREREREKDRKKPGMGKRGKDDRTRRRSVIQGRFFQPANSLDCVCRATLFRIPRRWSKKLVKDKGGLGSTKGGEDEARGRESNGGRKAVKKGRREASKGDKKDGRELTGSQPSASPRQFRLQGFLLYGLCSGTNPPSTPSMHR